jgi:hypothetical protein
MEITNTQTLIREMFKNLQDVTILLDADYSKHSEEPTKRYSEFKLADNFLKQKSLGYHYKDLRWILEDQLLGNFETYYRNYFNLKASSIYDSTMTDHKQYIRNNVSRYEVLSSDQKFVICKLPPV